MRKLVSLEEKKNLLHARSLVCFQFPPFLPVYTDSRESGIDIADKQRKVLTILFFLFSDDISEMEKDPDHGLNLKGMLRTAWHFCKNQERHTIPINPTSSSYFPGYPRNPYNDVICNDTIAASGVFTAKELCRLAKGKHEILLAFKDVPFCSVHTAIASCTKESRVYRSCSRVLMTRSLIITPNHIIWLLYVSRVPKTN